MFPFIAFLDPPEITKPETGIREVRTRESTTVECLANGNPGPQYVWTNAAGGVLTTDRHLILTNVDDSDGGNYTCTVTNDLDSASFTILVKIKSKFRLCFLENIYK